MAQRQVDKLDEAPALSHEPEALVPELQRLLSVAATRVNNAVHEVVDAGQTPAVDQKPQGAAIFEALANPELVAYINGQQVRFPSYAAADARYLTYAVADGRYVNHLNQTASRRVIADAASPHCVVNITNDVTTGHTVVNFVYGGTTRARLARIGGSNAELQLVQYDSGPIALEAPQNQVTCRTGSGVFDRSHRLGKVFLPAAAGTFSDVTSGGGFVLQTLTSWPGHSVPTALWEGVFRPDVNNTINFQLPPRVVRNVTVLWRPETTGSGNVVWVLEVYRVTTSMSSPTHAFLSETTAAAPPSGDTPVRTTVLSSLLEPPATDSWLHLRIFRWGTNASDTLPVPARLIGVEVS